MREYGQVQCAFWQSRDAQQASDAGKLLATYLMTGPHSNGIGCYRCPDGYVMADLGWSSERVSEGFAELSRSGFAYRHEGVVCMPNFLFWNKVANGNVAKARMAEFMTLPKGQAKAVTARAMLTFCAFLDEDSRDFLGTVAETVLETVWQTEPNPTQPRENQEKDLSTTTSPTAVVVVQSQPAKPNPTVLAERRAQRLGAITDDAIAKFNATLAKPHGKLAAVSTKVGRKTRLKNVDRCLQTASEICEDQFGDKKITPEFWAMYFAACLEDDFANGTGPYSGDHANWRPDFEYLTRPATMLKMFERATDQEHAA
jgi:hypothetical protein